MGDCKYTIRAGGSIVFAESVELDEEDIIFLKSVREVNLNPEEYAERGDKKGATPATIERVSRISNLEDHQIEYRLDARGYVDAGYLELFPVPEDTDGGGGARSFRLTERGVEIVEIAEREMPGFTGLPEEVGSPDGDESYLMQGEIDDPIESLLTVRGEVRDLAAEVDEDSSGEGEDQLAELVDKVDRWFLMAATELQRSRSRIDSLESDVEDLQSAVGQLQGQADHRFGMWDQREVEEYHASTEAVQGLRFVAHCGLGVDTERLIEDGDPPFSEQEIQRTRAEIVDTVASGSGGEG